MFGLGMEDGLHGFAAGIWDRQRRLSALPAAMLDRAWAVVRVYSLVFTVVWPCLPIICLRGPLSYVLVLQSLSSVAGKEIFASAT